jgi:hypothetical protein
MNESIKESSIVNSDVQLLKEHNIKLPTSVILIFLVIVFLGLKSFIYLKDSKRDGL